jgi:hypothetical protein
MQVQFVLVIKLHWAHAWQNGGEVEDHMLQLVQ